MTMTIIPGPAAAWRAFVRAAGRHLARRAYRHIRKIEPRDLEAFLHDAREFSRLMQGLRGRARQCWRQVRSGSLVDAHR
jgi:hypothetical protein